MVLNIVIVLVQDVLNCIVNALRIIGSAAPNAGVSAVKTMIMNVTKLLVEWLSNKS